MLPPPPRDDNFHRRIKRDAIPAPTDPIQSIILCTPGTETFIKLTRKPRNGDLNYDKSSKEIQEQIALLVGNTWTFIGREHLPPKGQDGVINNAEGWVLERTSSHGRFKLQVANAHHKVPVTRWGGHGSMKIVGNEVTWGVLGAALSAVGQYMAGDKNAWGKCDFEIWDGRNQVGVARIVGLD